MRSGFATLAALGLALSGCLGGAGDAARVSPAENAAGAADPVSGLPLNNTTMPILGPAVDPWLAGETERVLLDAPIDIGPCPDVGYYLEFHEVYFGCSNSGLPDGTLLPEGTGFLRIESDAGSAPHHGGWAAFISATSAGYRWEKDNRSVEGEPVTTSSGVWSFPLVPADWDHPAAGWSSFRFGYYAYGAPAANVLTGPIQTAVVAVRDPTWTPQPTPDAWRIPDAHRIPQEGVITLLDANLSTEQVGTAAAQTSGRATEWHRAEDLVPAGATQLIVAASWTRLDGCPATFACSLRIDTDTPRESFGGYSHHPPAEVGPAHVVYVFEVPDEIPPESVLRGRSGLTFYVYAFNQCQAPVDGIVGDCKRTFTDASFDARLVVEAWRGEADLAAVKARLGVV